MSATNAKPIGTAVVGTGMSATVFHIPFIRSLPEHFHLIAIVERKATPESSIARDRYGSQFPNLKVANTLEEVLTDEEVELVVISTPNATHHPYAKAALRAGKHVIIEKPLVNESFQATELIQLAKSKSLVIATYQNRRWDSDFLTLRRLLESERVFGEVSEFETKFDRWKPVLKGNDTWREKAEWGNSILFDLGSHLIDQVITLFGTPSSISGHVWNSRGLKEGLDDAFIAHFIYPPSSSKASSSHFTNPNIPLHVTVKAAPLSLLKKQLRFSVKGTKASWTKYGVDPQEDQLKSNTSITPDAKGFGVEDAEFEGTLVVEEDGKIVEKSTPTDRGHYLSWFKNVGEAIQAKDPSLLIVKPEQAQEVIRLIELIYQSHEEGRVIQV
ncbi:uncharacterized protein EI90DRAFT_3027278 [Cantharellus anzutake]|uniref:uncharacterized protein n=1 Tax=Cantharellus anzutake TaxID=1750568 RepID=UPI0019089BD5|nr:uncharacterized protein EI90DRAFT_3027278 [Cantharellus anzutake]KAF8343837.1 hypothetical protein EI90DRAFT_3027278 [Cantharellus anzutake]